MKLHLLVIFMCSTVFSHAQWTNNPLVNTAIATATGYQGGHSITTDGSGGALIAWYSIENDTTNYIYVQRVDAQGTIRWAANGVLVCAAPGYRYFPQITSNGTGGAFISWADKRSGNYDIYAQLVDSNGVCRWAVNGKAVCAQPNDQMGVCMLNQTTGNCTIGWFDYRTSINTTDIYIQRLDSDGNTLWQANGVPVCTAANYQLYLQMTIDSSNGAIVCWQDNRAGNYDIYTQRITSAGTAAWTVNGVALCTATGTQGDVQLTPDGGGGAILTWKDYRSGSASDVYARKINSAGVAQWAADGVPVCTAPNYQEGPKIIPDGKGGAIIMYNDYRNGTGTANGDIYAQRIDANGTGLWTANGLPVCTNAANQTNASIATLEDGGAVISWMDKRGADQDIYAQIINSDGAGLWQANGIAICKAAGNQDNPVMVSDGQDGAIAVWNDLRIAGDGNLYASRITKGIISVCPAASDYLLSSNVTGASYQWQQSTDNGVTFINIADDAYHTGVATPVLQLNSLPSSWYGYQYRCKADTSTSIPFRLRFVSRWNGAISNDWSDTGNWSCGTLPDANTDVILPNGTIRVNINTGCRSLSVKPGVNLTIQPGRNITILK